MLIITIPHYTSSVYNEKIKIFETNSSKGFILNRFCVNVSKRKTPRIITTKGVTMWFVQNGLVQEYEL